jgi:hypothetical protein
MIISSNRSPARSTVVAVAAAAITALVEDEGADCAVPARAR